jgi:proline dehydrogenase
MAGVFAHTVRPAIMAASRWEGLRRAAERMPVTRKVVGRFVPGETIECALNSVAVLCDSGRYVSIDYLGEDVTEVDDADAARSRASCRRWVSRWSATARRSRGKMPGRSAPPRSVPAFG